MRKRNGKARRTHYAVRQAGDDDTGKPTPENSLSPAVAHFFECDGVTTDTDSAPSAGVSTPDFTGSGESISSIEVNTLVGATPNTVRIMNWYNTQGTAPLTTGWKDPAGKDFIMMVCARAEDHGIDSPKAGPISFYMGDGNRPHCRIQAYKGGCQTSDGFFETENTDESKRTYPLIDGEDYIYATAYRNGRLEHYATIPGTNGLILYTGDVEVDMSPAKWSPDNAFNCGHGRLERGQFAFDREQDSYAFLVVHFTSGLPPRNEIISAMEFHLEQWVNDNKVVYPNWISEI